MKTRLFPLFIFLITFSAFSQSKEEAVKEMNSILKKAIGKTLVFEEMGVLTSIKVFRQEFIKDRFTAAIQIKEDLPLYQTAVIPWKNKLIDQSQKNEGYVEFKLFFKEEFTSTLANAPDEEPIDVTSATVIFFIAESDYERFSELVGIMARN